MPCFPSDSGELKPRRRCSAPAFDHEFDLRLRELDHERLTFMNSGAERRLTDVHGEVIRPVLA